LKRLCGWLGADTPNVHNLCMSDSDVEVNIWSRDIEAKFVTKESWNNQEVDCYKMFSVVPEDEKSFILRGYRMWFILLNS
jgi:hypothetical protein